MIGYNDSVCSSLYEVNVPPIPGHLKVEMAQISCLRVLTCLV